MSFFLPFSLTLKDEIKQVDIKTTFNISPVFELGILKPYTNDRATILINILYESGNIDTYTAFDSEYRTMRIRKPEIKNKNLYVPISKETTLIVYNLFLIGISTKSLEKANTK